MMMMRFAGGVTVAGIIGFIIVEALKILMVPITAWVMPALGASEINGTPLFRISTITRYSFGRRW